MTATKSNVESLVLYTALKEDAAASLAYWQGLPDDAIDKQLNVTNYSELVVSHDNNIARIKSQLADDMPAAKNELQKIYEFFVRLYGKLKDYIPEDFKKWLELLIRVAKDILDTVFKDVVIQL